MKRKYSTYDDNGTHYIIQCDDCPQISEEALENKEQDKDQRVAELEEEIRLVKAERDKWKNDYKNCSELERMECKEHQYCLDNWLACEKESETLKEQLKNSFVPKFKYHQIVYAVANTDILKGRIDVFDIYQKKYLVHFYGIDDINSFGDMWCYEKEIFTTEVEAQKNKGEEK